MLEANSGEATITIPYFVAFSVGLALVLLGFALGVIVKEYLNDEPPKDSGHPDDLYFGGPWGPV
ncbi:MAG: hypothetical protein HS130_01020 [Deltaproteobacteria bacterium]|nr:hypothetical protein [Deltaproteobacteria bacterium]MCL4873832.1 hypothetical protein [bacterium]